MCHSHTRLTVRTEEGYSLRDITSLVKEFVVSSGVQQGHVLVFTTHTTTGIRINEHERRLLEDLKQHLEEIAPRHRRYLHDDLHLRDCPPDERPNGHSHLKAISLNSSECIPIIEGHLQLGKWQSILFLDLDGGRTREIILQVMGEK